MNIHILRNFQRTWARMHVEALADNPKVDMAAIKEGTGTEPLILDNLEGVFLLCSVVAAAAVVALAAEVFGKNVAGFFKCLGVYIPERRMRNCDVFARRLRRSFKLLPK